MPKKRPNETGKRGRGRPGIKDAIDPILEARVEFIAEQHAAFKTRAQIIKACADEGWTLSAEQIDRYIAEVRRRWRAENSLPDIAEKKAEAIKRLQAIYQKAAERKTFSEFGKELDSPDLWMMRQVILDILKIEGILDHKESSNGDLDAILDRLAEERAARSNGSGPH